MRNTLTILCLFICSISFGQKVTTEAGTANKSGFTTNGASKSTVLFNKPYGMAPDANGNIWITNEGSHAIFMWRKSDEKFYVRAGNQGNLGYKDDNGINAQFDAPKGIAVGSKIYVADAGNHCIRQIDQFTSLGTAQSVTLLAGNKNSSGFKNGTGSAAQFDTPTDVAVDSKGNIYVADQRNHCIRKITSLGVVTTFAGQPGSSGGTRGHKDNEAKFKSPTGLFIDGDDNVWVADQGNGRICKIDASTDTMTVEVKGLYGPTDVFIDAQGTIIASNRCEIAAVNPTFFPSDTLTAGGGPLDCGFKNGNGKAAKFNGSRTILQSGVNTYLISDANNHVIRSVEVAACDVVKAKINVVGKQPFCIGDSLELQGSRSFTNKWTFVGGNASGASYYAKGKGLYKLEVTATIGITSCSDTSSVWVKEPFPQPNPKILARGPLSFCPGGSVELLADQDYREYLWSTFERTKIITSEETDTYWLRVEDQNGCEGTTSTVTTELFKTTQPKIKPHKDFTICQGDSGIMTADTGYAIYDWSNGANSDTIYIKAATSDLRLTTTDKNGCVTKSKLPLVNVTVNPQPAKPDVGSENDSVYTKTVSTNYGWYKDGEFLKSTTVPYIIAEADGDYSVEIEDDKGCKNKSDEITVLIVSRNTVSGLSLEVYPNPANNQLNLVVPGSFTYQIRDISGKTLLVGNNERNIGLSSLSEGTYFIEVTAQNQVAQVRFTIIR